MKDQKAILLKCLKNDEPVFVLAGHDAFAVATMEAYLKTATENGADDNFLQDMQLVIDEMKLFQEQEAHKVRIPTLKNDEKRKTLKLYSKPKEFIGNYDDEPKAIYKISDSK